MEPSQPTTIRSGFDASVKQPNVLVHADGFIACGESIEQSLDEVLLVGDVAIVKDRHEWTVRMGGPAVREVAEILYHRE